jgi:hypothetical protein
MILAIVLEMLGAHAGLGWSIIKIAIYASVTWISRRAVWW